MSKIEVLRAGQLTKIVGLETVAGREFGDVILRTKTADVLLTALLEDAGAVKVRIDASHSDNTVQIHDHDQQIIYGYHWLLPIREKADKP